MTHNGQSVDEILAQGAELDPLALHHAMLEEEQEQVSNLEGLLNDDDEDGDGDTSTSTDRDSTTTRAEDNAVVRSEETFSEEIIESVQREYFDIQTPEAFLDDFQTAFTGFAVSAAAAGLSDADFEQMIDPRSGFMQGMLTEFIGEQAKRALASGDTPFETVGVEGDPEFEGSREGDVSSTSFHRLTRTEAEEQLRRDGVEVTNESVTQLIEKDAAEQQAAATSTSTSTSSETRDSTEETTSEQTGTTDFSGTEDVFSRPQIAQVFKFSPNDFFLKKFALPEGLEQNAAGTEKFIGMISTQIRAAAPKARPGGGSTQTSVSARRT